MSNCGHIKIPRSLRLDPLWKSLSYQYRHVFETVLHYMAFKEIIQDDFGVLTRVQPFQLLTTKAQLTKWCDQDDIDESLVYRVFLKLEKLHFWNCKTNHRKTLITITRADILETIEPTFEPNSNQTRTKLEPQKKNINTDKEDDHDLIDARVLSFDHRKLGKISINLQDLIENFISKGWPLLEIEFAIERMKKQNPSLNGSVENYLEQILENKKNEKMPCKQKKIKNSSKMLPIDSGYYLDNDTSEAPLAKFALQTGYK